MKLQQDKLLLAPKNLTNFSFNKFLWSNKNLNIENSSTDTILQLWINQTQKINLFPLTLETY